MSLTADQKALVDRLKAELGIGVRDAVQRLERSNWDYDEAIYDSTEHCQCGGRLKKSTMSIMDATEYYCVSCSAKYTKWWRTGQLTRDN
jgi:hypothetical protein